MAPKSNPADTEGRLEQLERDMGTLARMMLDHQGAKPSLLRIIERYSETGQETRPHQLDETRAA
jgi:hypothetical protein